MAHITGMSCCNLQNGPVYHTKIADIFTSGRKRKLMMTMKKRSASARAKPGSRAKASVVESP